MSFLKVPEPNDPARPRHRERVRRKSGNLFSDVIFRGENRPSPVSISSGARRAARVHYLVRGGGALSPLKLRNIALMAVRYTHKFPQVLQLRAKFRQLLLNGRSIKQRRHRAASGGVMHLVYVSWGKLSVSSQAV